MEVQTEAREERKVARTEGNNRGREDGAAGGNSIVLGPRDSLVGKLTIEGDLHIHGSVEGEVKASGDISVDSGGNVKAQLEGKNVSIRGQVDGNVTAKQRLQLAGSGRVNGDVRVARLTVEDGATLNGNVQMRSGSDGAEHKG